MNNYEKILIEKINELSLLSTQLFNSLNLKKFLPENEVDLVLNGYSEALSNFRNLSKGYSESKSFFKKNFFIKDPETLKLLIREADFLIRHFKNVLGQEFAPGKSFNQREFYFRGEGRGIVNPGDSEDKGYVEFYFLSDQISFSQGSVKPQAISSLKDALSKAAGLKSIFYGSLEKICEADKKVAMAFHILKEFMDLLDKALS